VAAAGNPRCRPDPSDLDLTAAPGGHMRRWAGAWLLAALFVASLVLHALFQLHESTQQALEHGQLFTWSDWATSFGTGVFENWQSEWAQLFIQALVIQKGAERMFRAGAESELRRFEWVAERLASIERKIDEG
jgi:hypothetical protein